MEVALFLGAPVALGFAAAFALATSAARAGALLAAGIGLGVVFVLVAYLSSPTSAAESNCSDCGEFGGRYWEPLVTVVLTGALVLLWSIGVAAGTAVRRLRDAGAPGAP